MASCALADPPPEDSPTERPSLGPIAVDVERGEVRIPSLFVNPSRLLEVFACHEGGPVHETVLAFQATGPEIRDALLTLGARPAGHWGMGFEKTQGDRILVLVRWAYKGVEKELPAEALLHEAADAELGFPAFVRGFSFGAARRSGNSPPGRDSGNSPPGRDSGNSPPGRGSGAPPDVPDRVEITLGATKRQSSSFSLLSHPSNLPRLRAWALPPSIHRDVVVDLQHLVEREIPATLILRRIPSEVALVDSAAQAAHARGLPERLELLKNARPLAADIDALKESYEEVREALRSIVEPAEAASPAGVAAGQEERVVQLLLRERLLAAQVEERYLTLYQLQESHRLTWLEAHDTLDFRVRDEAMVYAREGVPQELRLARKEVELAALRLDEAMEPSAERHGRKEREGVLQLELEAIRADRAVGLMEANVKFSEWNFKNAEDAYSRRLLEQEVLRAEAGLVSARAKRALLGSQIDELKARHEGRWEAEKDKLLRTRSQAERDLRRAQLGEERVELLRELRWARDDVKSAEGKPDLLQKRQEELRRLQAKLVEVEAGLAED